jgi:hypoxanthine phosphoribosyltransferase
MVDLGILFQMEEFLLFDDDIESVLYDGAEIEEAVCGLAERINRDYRGKSLTMVVVLSGAIVFASDLIRRLDLPVELDFMRVSSYGSSVKSSGVVRITNDLSTDISGKDVLIVEDILDTGLTINYLIKNLRSRGPASLEVVSLLKKDCGDPLQMSPKYHGLDCPDAFVVGYGLDYSEKYRNLPFLGLLKKEVYSG